MKSYKYGTILLTIILAGMISVQRVAAEVPSEKTRRIDLGIQIQDYRWAEYDDTSRRLLEETGKLYGLTCDFESNTHLFGWRSGVDFFFGQVDYDGRTWTDLPVQTDVTYVGSKVYCDIIPGYRFDSGVWLKPFVGFGGEFWLRDLDDTQTSTGDPVNGAREWWGVVYGRLGLGAEYPVAEEIVLFAEAGVKLPIYSRNEAEFFLSGSPRVGLEPEPDFAGFGNIGCRWKCWGAKASFDSLRFDRSDTVSSGTFNLYQPKSESDVYSLEVFWSKGF